MISQAKNKSDKIFLRPRLLSIRTTFFETNELMVNCFVFRYNFVNFHFLEKKKKIVLHFISKIQEADVQQ